MKLRKLLFWLHLTIGIVAGTVILIMSLTGVLLTYQKQMVAWSDRGYRSAPPSPDAKPRSMEQLVADAREGRPPSNPSAITLYSDPEWPAMIAVRPGLNLYVNPYNGQVLGEGSKGMRAFFQYVTSLHRWLAVDGSGRATARSITGASNLGFLFIVCSGLCLWWPRRWSKQSVRSVTWFKSGLSGRPRNFNWHNTFGFWSALPLFFVVLSGVVMSYSWANNLVYRVTGSEVPSQPAPRPEGPRPEGAGVEGGRRGGGEGGGGERQTDLAGIDILWNRAATEVPGWKSMTVRFPTKADSAVSFAIDRGNGGQPQLRSTLTMDRKGQIVGHETFEDQSAGRRARSWLRFVHTGEFYGAIGQTFAGLASLGGVMLVCTGFLLSLARLRGWLAKVRPRNGILVEQPWERSYDRTHVVGNDQS